MNTDLERRIEELERQVAELKNTATIDPNVKDAFASFTDSTPSAGYSGRFLINGKEVDYI